MIGTLSYRVLQIMPAAGWKVGLTPDEEDTPDIIEPLVGWAVVEVTDQTDVAIIVDGLVASVDVVQTVRQVREGGGFCATQFIPPEDSTPARSNRE